MNLKFISKTAHGIIDWITVPMLPVLPRIFGWDRPVRRLHDLVGGGIAASAAFTDYPAGVVKVMPMKTHLMLDKMNGALFLAAAAIMNDKPPAARQCMAATGLFLLVNGLCTRTQDRPKPAQAGRQVIEDYARERRPDIYGRQADSGMRPEMAGAR